MDMEHPIHLDGHIPEGAFIPPPGSITRVAGITTNAATSTNVQFEQIEENLKLGLPLLATLPEFNKVKGKNKKIALVGGGSSLKDEKLLKELSMFKTIMACGSVHDYLITQGIIPTYASNCDPDAVCAGYYTKSDTEVKYLIASNAAKEVLDTLKDKQIVLWHCHSDEIKEKMIELETKTYKRDYQAVGGGCTVGLRSISIALCLGYSNIHLFGFDSCMGADGSDHHAYDWANPEVESKLIERVHKIQIGTEEGPLKDGKHYYVAGYQLAQMENFKDFYSRHKEYFMPTFHGKGALHDYYKLIKSLESKNQELKNVA